MEREQIRRNEPKEFAQVFGPERMWAPGPPPERKDYLMDQWVGPVEE